MSGNWSQGFQLTSGDGWILALSGALLALAAAVPLVFAPQPVSPPIPVFASDQDYAWWRVEDFQYPLAQFDSVFWEPKDTESLRQLIRETPLVKGKTMLEIGTGTGIIALCCLRAGATHVLATDVNPAAVANARYNAELHGLDERLETRLVPLQQPEAYSVLRADEQFDIILSNPPWEDRRPGKIDQFALYDPGFALLNSIVRGANERLKPGGRVLLVYGSVTAIRRLHQLASECAFHVVVHDERDFNRLPEVFLPGMLIELRRQPD